MIILLYESADNWKETDEKSASAFGLNIHPDDEIFLCSFKSGVSEMNCFVYHTRLDSYNITLFASGGSDDKCMYKWNAMKENREDAFDFADKLIEQCEGSETWEDCYRALNGSMSMES